MGQAQVAGVLRRVDSRTDRDDWEGRNNQFQTELNGANNRRKILDSEGFQKSKIDEFA